MIPIPPDKYGHFGIGAILGLSALWIGWLALLPLLAVAAGKEAWDHAHPPHRAEVVDFLATAGGGLLSIGLIALHRAGY